MAEDDRTLRWRLLRWGLSDDDDEEDDEDSSWLWQRFEKERKDVAVDDDDDDDDGGGGMVVIEYFYFFFFFEQKHDSLVVCHVSDIFIHSTFIIMQDNGNTCFSITLTITTVLH